MAKRVTTIPATLNKFTLDPIILSRRRRTAGYARVSTDSEDQTNSYEAQVDYYTRYIESKEEWEFVGIYTDDGITGTNTKRRKGFNEMVEDALSGKIDLIVTKSISRFARNTVDSLVTVRKLKEKGVEIYFEKENIWTLDSKGELLITIMSSLAQEESRSISENTTWGKRKSFSDGKASVAYKNFLGYDRGENGEFVINPTQAKVVELIYKLFLEGRSAYKIAIFLTELRIPTPMRKEVWQQSTILSILSNEKYKGDALLQKEYTEDFLTKKRRKNQGEIPQYYVEGHHDPIISKEVFEAAQTEMQKRKSKGRYSGAGIFASKIKCGECGGWYGSKVWHSTDKYRKVVYQCNHKFAGNKKCVTPNLTEEELKNLFLKMVNSLYTEKEELIENTRIMMETLCTTFALEEEQKSRMEEMQNFYARIQEVIFQNSRVALNQDEYQIKYQTLMEKYEKSKGEYERITEQIKRRKTQGEQFKSFIAALESQNEILSEFDEGLWCNLVDFITVKTREDICFTLKNGMEVQA